jgi:hypothetical protein
VTNALAIAEAKAAGDPAFALIELHRHLARTR